MRCDHVKRIYVGYKGACMNLILFWDDKIVKDEVCAAYRDVNFSLTGRDPSHLRQNLEIFLSHKKFKGKNEIFFISLAYMRREWFW